jgi:zinc-ribbon domain
MASELHCSACDAVIQRGNQFCPACGLQLMAQAQPAVYVEGARFPLWSILLVAIAAFVIFAGIMSSHDNAKAADSGTAFAADLQAGKLSSPAAFEARCGHPRWTKTTAAGAELHYAPQDIFVTLASSGPRFEKEQVTIEDGKASTWRTAMDPAAAAAGLGCK